MPIIFPDFCYKSINESVAMLSDSAIGPPNIPASLSEGHVRYEAPQGLTKKKQKILLFNAFNVIPDLLEQHDSASDPSKANKFLAVLHQLLQEGFDIFIPVDPPKCLEPIKHYFITSLFLQSSTKSVLSNAEILQQAQSLNLNGKHTYDDFLVLDNDRMNEIIEFLSKQPDAKNSAHLYEDEISSDCDQTYSLSISQSPESFQIIYQHTIDLYSNLSPKYTLADVDFIDWSGEWMPSSINDKEDWLLKSLSLRGIDLIPRKFDINPINQIYLRRFLPYTTSLMFFENNKPTESDLIDYLFNSPRLKKVKIYLQGITVAHIPLKPSVQELELKNCNAMTLNAFLSASPQLKELCLEMAELIGIKNTMKRLNALPNVLKLTLKDPVINVTAQEGKFLDKDFPELKYTLPNLQYLNLYMEKGELSTICLVTTIINNAPNLCSINLRHCKDTTFINLLLAKIPKYLQKKTNEISLPINYLSSQKEWERSDQDIDADTSPKEVTFTPKTLFQGLGCENPPTNHYRLGVTSDCRVNSKPCTINKAFSIHYPDPSSSLKQAKTTPLTQGEIQQQLINFRSLKSQDKFYHNEMRLNLTAVWKSLPSLKPYDQMLCHSVTNCSGTLMNHLVDIHYSETENLYYIHLKESTLKSIDVMIDFVIKHDYAQITKDYVASDSYVENLSLFFNSFSENKPLNLVGETDLLGSDYADAIIAQETGACRHRSMACIYWMRKIPSLYEVRYVNNEVHAYVEIKPPKLSWITVDLGGTNQGVTLLPKPFGLEERKVPFERVYFPKTEPLIYEDTDAYCSHLLEHKENCFIETLSMEESMKIAFLLQEKAQKEGYSCFVVNSPDELTCPAPSIHLIDDQLNAELIAEHGGPFYQFLTVEPVSKKLLIIYFEKFSSADKVRCNSAFDKEPQIDGIPFPLNMQVVVIGKDHDGDMSLMSRFSRKEKYLPSCVTQFEPPSLFISGTKSVELQSSTSLPTKFIESKHNPAIDLYASKNHWKSRLLGEWHLHGSRISYVKGPLICALEDKRSVITIMNPPIDSSDYQQFWQQLLLTKKISFCNGLAEVEIPKGFRVLECVQETFTQEMIAVIKRPIHQASPPKGCLVLNPSSFRTFFCLDVINNEQQLLYQKRGVLFNGKDKSLAIYLSHYLSLENWREFLITCQQQDITIDLFLAPNVELPLFLQHHPFQKQTRVSEVESFSPSHYKELRHEVSFIQSSDRDVTIKQLEAICPSLVSVDVSELEANDLLEHVSGKLEKKTSKPQFSFQKRNGVLLEALSQKKTVILHGTMSQSLQHALSSWFIEQTNLKLIQGQLIIISEDNQNPFIGLPGVYTFFHKVALEEKKALLPQSMLETHDAYDWSMPLVNLLALSRCKTSDPWAGMYSLPSLCDLSQKETITEIDISTESADQFEKKRESQVELALSNSPFIFLAGISGVGKTTFVRNYFKESKGTLFEGKNSIRQWAESTIPGRKILFIDEANITSRNWSEFEGLFSATTHIVLDGLLISVKSEHQVVFAGNPVSYSEDRHQPLLFKRHGNSIVFEPLSLPFIFQSVLKPALKQMNIHDVGTQIAISIPILNAALFFTRRSMDNVLITPRELETIALLTAMRCQPPEIRFKEISNHYVSMVARTFVPNAYLQTFDEIFPNFPQIFQMPLFSPEFTLTSTNREAAQMINDFLALRDRRQDHFMQMITGFSTTAAAVNPIVTQGLGGVIIEGQPGIGKSRLAKTILEERGLHAPPRGNWNIPNLDGKMYYHVIATMSMRVKKQLLCKAFDEGAVVIWDEMNSSYSMERLLNSLLIGTTLQGVPPKKPGFFLIGTQNPSSFPGRHDTSVAIKHRIHYRVLPIYPDDEAALVLRNIGWVPLATSRAIIDEKKKVNQEGGALSFRDAVESSYQVAKKDLFGINTLQVSEKEVRTEINTAYQKESERLIQDMIEKQAKNLFFSKSKNQKPPCEACNASFMPESAQKKGEFCDKCPITIGI